MKSQTTIYFNEEFLVAIGMNQELLILAARGMRIPELVKKFGSTDLVPLGFYKDDLPGDELGLYFWKGSIKVVAHQAKDLTTVLEERFFEGSWYDAQLRDLTRFDFPSRFLL